jgi:uncharacterized membrane protein YidH (DUF202 family)
VTSGERDPGLAAERTTLAWQRTGLSALALAALAVHSFQDRLHLAVPVATVLAVVGATAYRTGSGAGPTTPARLRLVSLGVTAAAVLSGVGSIVG